MREDSTFWVNFPLINLRILLRNQLHFHEGESANIAFGIAFFPAWDFELVTQFAALICSDTEAGFNVSREPPSLRSHHEQAGP